MSEKPLTPSETTEAPYGRCKVCGEPIPKYKLDRYTDDLCGHACERYLEGVEAGRRMGQGSSRMFSLFEYQEAVRLRCSETLSKALDEIGDMRRVADTDGERTIIEGAYNRVRALRTEQERTKEAVSTGGPSSIDVRTAQSPDGPVPTLADRGSPEESAVLPPSDGTVRDLAERLLARLFRQGRIENHGHRMSHQAGKESGCSECRDVNRLIAALAYTAPEQPSANVSPDAPHDEHRRRVRQWWLTEMGDPPSGEVGKSLARLLDEAFDLGVERGRQMAEGKLDIGKLLADAGAVAREAVLREAMDALRGDTTLSLITEPGRQNARAVRVVERLLTPQGTTEEKK